MPTDIKSLNIYDAYTRPALLKDAMPNFKITPGPMVDNPGYEAVIVSLQEDLFFALTPTILLPDGALLGINTVQFAHAWKDVATDQRAVAINNHPMYSYAQLFRLSQVSSGGINLGRGSYIGSDGPPEALWIVGTYKGRTIKCETYMTGVYNNHNVLSPVYQLVEL